MRRLRLRLRRHWYVHVGRRQRVPMTWPQILGADPVAVSLVTLMHSESDVTSSLATAQRIIDDVPPEAVPLLAVHLAMLVASAGTAADARHPGWTDHFLESMGHSAAMRGT